MKIEELKILSAVFKEPNLTKIAKRFHLSQSNLSKIIRKLEEEMGLTLFERKGFQGLKPTPQGAALADRIQQITRSWEDTLTLAKTFDSRRLDLKVTGPTLYMRNIFLPKWFASSLSTKYRLIYVQSRLDQIGSTAESSDIDIVITPSTTELSDWVPIPIFKERYAVFTSHKKAPKSLDEINFDEKFWIGYRASNDILHGFFHHQQISLEKITAYIDDVESILDIIRDQPQMLALLPSHAENTHPELKTFPIKQAGQNLYLMYRHQNNFSQTAAKEIKALHEKLG